MLKYFFTSEFVTAQNRRTIQSKARPIAAYVRKKSALSAPSLQYRYRGQAEGRLWKKQAKTAQILDQRRQLARLKCFYKL